MRSIGQNFPGVLFNSSALGGRGPPTATRPARPPNKPNERPGHRHAPNETSGEGRGRGTQEGQDAAPSPANQHAHRRPPKQTDGPEPQTEGEVAAGVMVAEGGGG